MLRRALLSLVLLLVLLACSDAAPRIHATRSEVPAGEAVVIHLEDATAAPRAGRSWVTLAPLGAPESFVGRRVMIGADTHVAVPTSEPGRYEVRLHDDFPARPHHLVARAKIEVVLESASATFMSK